MTDEIPEESYILIKFEKVGSAVFEVHYRNVTPGQVFACLPFLEVRAKNDVLRAEEKQVEKLSVPKPKIITPK